MPYIKISKSKSGASTVQLATKDHGRTVIIKHFGSAHDEESLKHLKRLAKQERDKPVAGQVSLFTAPLDWSRVRIISHRPEYLERVIFHYYNLLGFKELGPQLLFDLVLMRVFQPCSKLRSLRLLESHFGRSYAKDQAYRLLKSLADTGEEESEVKPNLENESEAPVEPKETKEPITKTLLLQKLHAAHLQYYGSTLAVVLYDVTTLYFESARDGDEYKRPGYSKDGKHNDPQILVGLLTNISGFPLGYETFAGNTFEGGTLLTSLQNWQKQFAKSRLRVVADAGMLSKINVEKLTTANFDFIVGARLKSVPASITKLLIAIPKIDHRIEEMTHNGHRLIVSYSEKRAKKDLHNLDKAIKRAQAIVDGKQSLKRRSKFVVATAAIGSEIVSGEINSDDGVKNNKKSKNTGKSKPKANSKPKSKKAPDILSINQAVIDQDKALAGLKGYLTNLEKEKVEATEVISQYKELIHVEQSFRMSKHDLRARPIFHFKEDSIKAHLLIVVMALAIGRLLEKTSGQSVQKTVEQLSNALSYALEDTATGELREQHPRIEELNLPGNLVGIIGGRNGFWAGD
jgi:transposase